jgi:hypothetical protein
MSDDTRDRVIRMEEKLKAMTERVTSIDEKVDRGFAEVEATLKDFGAKIDALRGVVNQEVVERKTRDRIAVLGISLARWAAGAVIVAATTVITNADRIGKWIVWLVS